MSVSLLRHVEDAKQTCIGDGRLIKTVVEAIVTIVITTTTTTTTKTTTTYYYRF